MPKPVEYRLANGDRRYRIHYRQPNGKSTEKSGFKSQKEANAWYAHTLISKDKGEYTSASDKKVPLGRFIQADMERTLGQAETTIANRVSIGTTWVLPYWERKTVASVKKPDVEAWVERIYREGAGTATIEKAHGILLRAFESAVESHLIPKNPAMRVKIPKAVKVPNVYLSDQEVFELAGRIEPRYKTLVGFLAYTGLRFGEASALRVGSINLDTRKASITRSQTTVKGKLVEGPTKTGELRDVYFPAFLRESLRQLTAGRSNDAYLFTAPRGGSVRLDDWRPREFYPAIDRCNETRRAHAELTGTPYNPFPAITPHDLRHTAASLAVSAGAHVKVVQRMLGHASAAMTLDLYADLFETDLASVSDALEANAAAATDVSFWSPEITPDQAV